MAPMPPGPPTWLCAWMSTAPGFPFLQLWAISSGDLLLSVLFDMGITSVTMDLAEHHIFCGGSDGSIFQVDLCSWVSGPLGLREPTVLCPTSQALNDLSLPPARTEGAQLPA
jgi:hypothetical protein